MRTVIIDNYDSFAFNLYQYLGELGERPLVVRNDAITLRELGAARPERLILSPGPGNPEDPSYFGICRQAILELGPTVPTLGICLGHQGICSAFGAKIVRAPRPVHGKTSLVHHDGQGLFHGLPQPLTAMRYHSLIVDRETLPSCLRITAHTGDVVMGVEHREYPIHGVQFHPESIGTPSGRRLLENFLFSGGA